MLSVYAASHRMPRISSTMPGEMSTYLELRLSTILSTSFCFYAAFCGTVRLKSSAYQVGGVGGVGSTGTAGGGAGSGFVSVLVTGSGLGAEPVGATPYEIP